MDTAEATAMEVVSEVMEVAPASTVSAVVIEDKGVVRGGPVGNGAAIGEPEVHYPTEVTEAGRARSCESHPRATIRGGNYWFLSRFGGEARRG